MNHFDYIDGILHAENVSLEVIAQEVGAPFYCYSTATLERHYKVFSDAFADIPSRVCYAMKANSNQAVLATLGKLGCGADVVSKGELVRALTAGISPKNIMFSGVGKTASEIDAALEANIFCFNVESLPELHQLSQRAATLNRTAPVSLRINPDIDPGTHAKISTGKAGDKFGIPWEDAVGVYQTAAGLPNIKVCGIDMHIGSQITELGPFDRAFSRLGSLIETLRSEGHEIEHVDLGGGLGIPYKKDNMPPPDPSKYAEVVKKHVRELECEVIFEPGRLIAGNAGILVGEVIYTKSAKKKTILIGNTAMNDLIRPTLYEAWHEIIPINESIGKRETIKGDLVGPVCETGDYIALNRDLPDLKAGDLYAIGSAGAYGAVQAGTYNSRPLVPEVLVNGDEYHIVRPRIDVDALIAMDSVPDWI